MVLHVECVGVGSSAVTFRFRFCPVAVNAVYNLYAVSNHSGTTMGGHYTAYCRNPNSGEWYTFNDSRWV